MFSISVFFLVLLITLSVAYPSDTGDDQSPALSEHQENATFVGPVGNLKHSITALNSKIQEDTLKAFEEVNKKLSSDVASGSNSHQAFDFPTSFSNDIGTVENIKVEGLSNITIVHVETDLFNLGSEFKLLIPNISIEATVKIRDDDNLESNSKFGAKLLRANVIAVSYEGTAVLALKSKNNKNQLIYKKFNGKQRARAGFQMQSQEAEEQQDVDKLIEEQLGKSLLLSALDNVMKAYLSAVQKEANSKLKKIDVETYLPYEFANRFFQGIASTQTNGGSVNGYDYLTSLYTDLIKEFMARQLNNLDPFTKNIRRKLVGMEGTWVYGIFTLTDGYVSGLSSVNIAVGNAVNGSPKPNSEGVVKFGSLLFGYNYAVDYVVAGYDSGSVTLSTYGASATFESRNGVILKSVTPADITLPQMTFSGPSRELQTTQGQGSPDFRVSIIEDHVKSTIRQKLATLITNGLYYVYN